MTDLILDMIDAIKYGILRMTPPAFSIPNKLSLEVHYDKDEDVYWAISDELPAFSVSAKTKEDLLAEVYETLLLYFDVPRYFAKRTNNTGQLTFPDGTVIKVSEKIELNYAN